MKDLKQFSQGQQNIFAATLTEFITEATKQNWVMLGDDKGNPVHLSRAGNPQVAFQNGDDRIYLRISSNLEAILADPNERKNVKLSKSPIYEVALTQGPAAGKTMLVIGVKADSNLKPLTTIPNLDTLIVPTNDSVGQD